MAHWIHLSLLCRCKRTINFKVWYGNVSEQYLSLCKNKRVYLYGIYSRKIRSSRRKIWHLLAENNVFQVKYCIYSRKIMSSRRKYCRYSRKIMSYRRKIMSSRRKTWHLLAENNVIQAKNNGFPPTHPPTPPTQAKQHFKPSRPGPGPGCWRSLGPIMHQT